MSYCTRIAAVLLGFGLALAPTGLAHASTIGGPSGPGTYTYDFSLPNGASFTLTQSGPLGDPSTTTLSSGFIGSPMDGYIANASSGTGDNATWTEIQFQYDEPDAPGSNTAASILSFTFTEPDSFWAQTDVTSFPDDGATYGGLLYMNRNVDGSFVGDPSDPMYPDYDFIDGTVHQGAYYDTYTPGNSAPDPQCTSCTLTVTFTPAVVGAVPEPSTMTLLGTGMIAVAGVYRRRRS